MDSTSMREPGGAPIGLLLLTRVGLAQFTDQE